MGYLLLWLESLTAALLLLATCTACAARIERCWLRRLAALTPALLLLVPTGGVVYGTGYLEFEMGLESSWFYPALAWAVVQVIGTVWVLSSGLRIAEPPLVRELGEFDEPEGPAGRSWPRTRLALCGGVAALLLLSTFTIMDTAARLQLAALRTEADALAAAAAAPRIADRDNAAPLYLEAFDALLSEDKMPPAWKAKSASWFNRGTPVDLNDADLRDYLRRQAAGLELLRQASAKPGCCFQHEHLDIDTLLPEATLHRSANLLALEARVAAARGDTCKALANVAAQLRIAQHICGQPGMMITLLMAVAVEGRGRDTLDLVLRDRAVTREELAPLKELDHVFYRPALQRSMQMEQAFALATFAGISLSDPEEMRAALSAPFWRLFFLDEDVAAYRELTRDFSSTLANPYPAAPSTLAARQQQRTKKGILTPMLTPALVKVGQAATRADASRRLVRLAVAVAEYRYAKGEYPTQVDDLVPEFLPFIPADPYTGDPLKLVVNGPGVNVYSIGPDGLDGKGTADDIRISLGTDVELAPFPRVIE